MRLLTLFKGGGLTPLPLPIWREEQPAGNTTKPWKWADIDGQNMVAVFSNSIGETKVGRAYLKIEGSWAELRPIGDNEALYTHAGILGNNLFLRTVSGAGGFLEKIYLYSIADDSFEDITPVDSTLPFAITGTKIFATGSGVGIQSYDLIAEEWTDESFAGDTNTFMFLDAYEDDCISAYAVEVVGVGNFGRIWAKTGEVWAEERPAGNVERQWAGVSIYGESMVAVVGWDGASGQNDYSSGRMYYKPSGGSWALFSPPGKSGGQYWQSVAITGTKIWCMLLDADTATHRLYSYKILTGAWTEEDVSVGSSLIRASGDNAILVQPSGNTRLYAKSV
jgi:hypothetical protein